jgi:DNA-binding winged helix-turn-helix (wHTH) protein
MYKDFSRIILFIFITSLAFVNKANAQNNVDDQHILVSMRLIGHKVLLLSGDRVSRVLPIEKDGNRYKIQFEKEFHFIPDELIASIKEVVEKSKIASSYIVEVEDCDSHQVIYSYEMKKQLDSDLIPCKERNQPTACYVLFFTIIDSKYELSYLSTLASKSSDDPNNNSEQANYLGFGLFIIPLILFIALVLYFRKRKNTSLVNSNLISIGEYRFDKKNMLLLFDNTKTVLTNKEAELLSMLYNDANKTIERDRILNQVWGDEGDYIGRTLDVFISKLRKKLAEDPSLKIINIRGIGYKFLMD